MDAVREALMNSFCHKDYGACQSNEVTIHPDRVEIYNPGTFPAGLSPQDFIDGNQRPSSAPQSAHRFYSLLFEGY